MKNVINTPVKLTVKNLKDFYFKFEINADGEYQYQWIHWSANADEAKQRLIALNLPYGLTTNISCLQVKDSDIEPDVRKKMERFLNMQ